EEREHDEPGPDVTSGDSEPVGDSSGHSGDHPVGGVAKEIDLPTGRGDGVHLHVMLPPSPCRRQWGGTLRKPLTPRDTQGVSPDRRRFAACPTIGTWK